MAIVGSCELEVVRMMAHFECFSTLVFLLSMLTYAIGDPFRPFSSALTSCLSQLQSWHFCKLGPQ